MPGNTAVGLSFDTTSIKQADEAIKKLVKNAEAGIGKVNKAWKDMTKDGLNHFIQRIGVAQRAMSRLSNARVNVKFSGQATDLKRLGDSASRAIPQVNKLLFAMQQLASINVRGLGGGGVSATAMDAQKINYLEQQIRLLQDQLKIQQEISNAVGSQARGTSNVRQGMSDLESVARRVRQIASTLFSVQALAGYVNGLIKVRGEFELQQRALQAIVQNVDEANKLWGKTVALAVQSPFRVKELVTYTKQLAAYRVETENLYDTTKMLADVSAGLGVDMQRLILAYGQVKAANYLRGTELRQFSEAGINVLGELATYFTELEGRVVSVGDVFERVSKRMVSFADVEEVFKRITSEGGIFFNMQEIQAETLKGQISNLKDSIDIMLNDIGKANEKTIKNMVALTRTFIEGWRTIGTTLTSLGAALSVVAIARAKDTLSTIAWTKANLGAIAAGKGFTSVVAKMILGFKNLWAAMLSNPITATYAALAALAVVIYKVVKRQRELNKAYEESVGKIHAQYIETKKYADSISELVARQNELIETNKTLSKDSDEYKSNQQEIATIEEKRKEILKELVKIDPEYAKSIQNAGNDLKTLIPLAEEYNEKLRARLALESSLKDINADESTKEYNEVMTTQRARLGDVERTRNTLLKEAQDLLSSGNLYEAERKALEEFVNGSEPYYKRATKLYKDLQTVVLDLGTVEQQWGLETRTVKKIGISTLFHRLDLDSRIAIEKYIKSLDKLTRKEKRVIKDMTDIAEEWKNVDMGVRLTSIIADEKATEEDKAKAKNEIISFFEEVLNEKGIVGAIADKARSVWSSIFEFDWKKTNIPTPLTGWRVVYDEFVKTLSTGAVSSITEEEDESSYIETLRKSYESYAKDIEGWDANNAKLRAQYTKEQMDRIKAENAERKKAIDWLTYEKKETGGTGENKELKELNERIRLVRELRKEYETLNKTFDAQESANRVRESFRKAWESIMPSDLSLDAFNFTNPEGVVAQLEELKTKIAPEAIELVNAIEKAMAEESVEIDVDFKKGKDKELMEKIQELFDQYDLSLELKKLNIPPDLAKSLFDVDYLDLEGLKKAVEDQKDAFVGKDMLDEYDDLMKKIGELSRKRQEDEAKEFISFLKKNLDEVKLIQDKGAYNIALADRLFGEGKITAEQYMSSIRQIVEDTNKEASRVNLEMFKDSPKYIQAMGDLTAYTTKEIRELIKSLEDVVAANSDAFSADEAKAYIDAIYNAQEKLDELEQSTFRWETFANIGEILKTDKDINDQKEERDRLQEQEKAQLEELVRLEEKLKRLQEEKNAILSGEGDLKSKANRLAPVQSDIDATTQAIQTGQKAVSATQSQAKTTETILGRLGDKMKGLTGKGGGAASTIAIIDAIINGINDTVQGILDITNEIGSVMESFGKETDMSTGFGKFQKGFAIFAESSQYAADGWNALKNGDPVGAVVSVVKSVTSLIRGINEYKDAKFQVEIDKQAKTVERLGKAYDKLEAATESAYSIQQLQQYNEELERNVELQIASYKAMIAAEQAKKNTDDEQIAAWNEELEALTQQWEDLKQSLLEGVGGVSEDNYRSQTREFVDAWVSAYKETGDGLKGLQDNFRDFFDNIIAEQAAMRVTEKFLEPFYESLNEALKDYELTVQESKDLREMVERIAPDLSSALEKIWGQLGGSRGDAEGGSLSALQKGIQGITEQTAQVLEAYFNSIRMYVATISADTTSQLNEVKAIHRLLDSVTVGGHSRGGVGFKVFMD